MIIRIKSSTACSRWNHPSNWSVAMTNKPDNAAHVQLFKFNGDLYVQICIQYNKIYAERLTFSDALEFFVPAEFTKSSFLN